MANQGTPVRPTWSSADDESLSLMLSLLHQDARQMDHDSKGKQPEGTLSDADLALQLYAMELNRAAMYASDRRMTKSMQEAVQADANALLELEREESVARNDRQIALSRSTGGPQRHVSAPADTGPSTPDPDMLEELMITYVTGNNEREVNNGTSADDGAGWVPIDRGGQPESSSWAASRRFVETYRRPCIACGDNKHSVDLARAPCRHEYCRDCLGLLFQNAMTDETLFPPRCCRQEILVDMNRSFLSSELVQKFKKKAIELSTPNRTYCHQSTCSTFIPPSMIQDGVGTCPECKTQTCITCKGVTHRGDCPSDTELQEVLQLAHQEQWQRCLNCSTMVELTTGCFHITCKCRAEFCYRCGARWKTCECPQWEEDRLYNRAEEIYDRNNNPGNGNINVEAANAQPFPVGGHFPPDPEVVAAREAGIQQIMGHLRENHECDHYRWYSRDGPEDCEQCGDEMPVFIYECRQCGIMACRRCRYNRL